MTDLADLERADLEAHLADLGAKPFHAGQVFRWIHRRGVTTFDPMSDLPRGLRRQLARHCVVSTPDVERRDVSADGTEKFLLRLRDGLRIEAVYIPETPRRALCLSTQVGCGMRCAFCLTGKMGLARNLTAGEIVGQVRVLVRALALDGGTFNIVLMGMGEPLHNYDATMKALRMLTAADGLAVPPRRITLSTVGVPDGLERLADEAVVPDLAVSLHAPSDELRAQIVPVTHRYGLTDILAACRRYPATRRRRLTFEYVLLAGVNDAAAHARELAALIGSLRAKVNLIPLNEAPGIPFRRPSDAAVDRFARTLAARAVTVSVRKSRGRDIQAACGQLLVEGGAGTGAMAGNERGGSGPPGVRGQHATNPRSAP